jgi:hypothetical protein
MVADGGFQIDKAREAPLVEVDDVKFYSDETKIAVVGDCDTNRQSGKFNDLSLHMLNSILEVVPVVWFRKMFRPAFAKSGGYNTPDQTHGGPRL